jgi:hypothetical protein
LDNINELIRDLDWSKPEDVQKKAMDLSHLAQQNELNYKYC